MEVFEIYTRDNKNPTMPQSHKSEPRSEEQKPKKKRDRLTVLKALSSTVGKIPNRPDYRFFDDVVLNPRSLVKKRELSLAIESGTKAAEYVLEKYPDLFPMRQSVPEWPTATVVSDDIEATPENLKALIQSSENIVKVVDMYQKLKDNETLTLDIQNQMLDFAAYHSASGSMGDIAKEVPSETQESSSSSSSSSSSEDENKGAMQDGKSERKSTWNSDGYAEQLFSELKDVGNVCTYEVFILGLLNHGEFIRAYHVFNDLKEKNFIGSSFLYDSLIKHVADVREGENDQWDLVEEVVADMKRNGVKPTTSTFNALFSVAVERENDASKLCQKLFGEMKKEKIVPSLGSLYYVLSAERKKVGFQDIQVLIKIVNELKNGNVKFDLIDPADMQLFHSAMDLARFKRNGDLARELLEIVLSNGLQHMLGPKSSAFYGNYLCAIARNTKDLPSVFEQYRRIVPAIITPRDWVYQQLFFAARNHKDPSFLPTLYSDIVGLRVPMNDRVASAMYSAMEHNIPQDRVAEYLHIVKDSGKWIEIFNIAMTSEMLSISIKILCLNGLASDAIEMTKKFKEQGVTPR